MKKLVLLLAGLLAMNMANAQKTIKLFPDGAPGETQKLTEKSDDSGAKVGGTNVIRMTDVGEPEIAITRQQQT